MTVVWITITVIAILIGAFFTYTGYQINQIPTMSFEDMLLYTTNKNEKVVIAVGVIQNGETSYTIYGENGKQLPMDKHVYEIGSLTKTFTTALLFKAIGEGKIKLDDRIDEYLDLPIKDSYPTIRSLITHTSGYKSHYLERQMISNFFQGRNSFYRISQTELLKRVGKIDLNDREKGFEYSNFGMAVVGALLSKVYDKDYAVLIDEYITTELGLSDTRISDGSGDLGNYWDWEENDAYMAAGALTSTIEDILKYAELQLNETPKYLADTHKTIVEVNATTKTNAKMNINIDAVGGGWMIDKQNNIIWHNGGTDDYNCYLGFDPQNKIAVVILSNLAPGYRIPATVMGIKLLTDIQKEQNR